jgi:hypothetical protein
MRFAQETLANTSGSEYQRRLRIPLFLFILARKSSENIGNGIPLALKE